ncbi:hypothetical protein BIV57_11540 [Mangrovactinospora gilvigrisea]|uniref:Histone acetyltransferase Rv0428c-like SH3 domain-containing protein n=1 Tax=Mangrovactinospora gilvigrisea TaxID=1428644 RepID=A0A1J7BFM7_9ACTN|nr:hypothetical protein BIV57_11540 [Mangrovactinospora gilvigrisea]
MRITGSDVGRRVSVRRVLEVGPEGRPVFGDVVGELLSWTDGRLAVRRRDGAVVEVDERALVAGKTVPPPPARRGRRRGAGGDG